MGEKDWVKLHVRFFADPKITGLPDADTEMMFVRGLARAGEIARGGFIPESDLPLLTRRRRMGACVRALVDAGLWCAVDGGYVVARWADWQSAADALAARRMAERERQRRHRQKQSSRDFSLSRDIEDSSRDVTPPRGERESVVETKGGARTHDPPVAGPPPRRCTVHADWPDDAQVPACGGCADARRRHERWQQDHPPPAADTRAHPLDAQQLAERQRAEEHMRSLAESQAVELETDGSGLRSARDALRRREPT